MEGEKTVTRYILEQTRRNGDDLVAIKSRLDRVEIKVDGLERRFMVSSARWTAWPRRSPALWERPSAKHFGSAIALRASAAKA